MFSGIHIIIFFGHATIEFLCLFNDRGSEKEACVLNCATVYPNVQDMQSKKKNKQVSKRMRRMREEEERMKEKEFERAFFREFWPDNV